MSLVEKHQPLLDIAAQVDVLDLSGRIIADPRRVRVSTADQLALALAVEAFWGTSIEALCLIRALDQAAVAPADDLPDIKTNIIKHAAEIQRRMTVLTGNTQET